MVTFNQQREQEKKKLKDQYNWSLDDYITKYRNFYDIPSEATQNAVVDANSKLNDKLKTMLKNNHAYSQKIHSSTKSNSEEWIAEWKAFQSRQGKNTEQIKEYHRKLNSKSGLVSQTQANYNNETNKFILYTIFF